MPPVREPSESYVLFLWFLAVAAKLRFEVRGDTLWVWFPWDSPRLRVAGFTDSYYVAIVPMKEAA